MTNTILMVGKHADTCRCDRPLTEGLHCLKCGRPIPPGKAKAADAAARKHFEQRGVIDLDSRRRPEPQPIAA